MNELDFSKIGLKMKALRTEQGITQEKVAEELGCTVSFISNVENNRTKLNLRLLLYYAALCHVSVDTLLDAGKEPSLQTDENHQTEAELLELFRTFSPEQQKNIIKTLRIWRG